MKIPTRICLVGFIFVLIEPIVAEDVKLKIEAAVSSCYTVKTTAYSHTEKDHIKYGRKTASGASLRYGKVTSAAADWSIWPLGTKFRIKGESTVYEIDDYGSALVGTRTIDLYRPSKSLIRKWGTRNLEIEIVKWGCFHESSVILASRLNKADHVDDMYASIQAVIKN